MKVKRVTVSVPADVREAMLEHPSINWSAVATEAFLAAIVPAVDNPKAEIARLRRQLACIKRICEGELP